MDEHVVTTARRHATSALRILPPLISAIAAVACSRSGSADVIPAVDNVAWIAATCTPESPDTTGWSRHRFSDVSIAVPPDFTVSHPTTRAIGFRRGTSTLSLSIGTHERSFGLMAAPDRSQHEKACPVMIGGYASEIAATWYGQSFSVEVEWDGRNFWPPGDWRQWLHASVTTTRLRDATVLRQALWTIRADRDTLR